MFGTALATTLALSAATPRDHHNPNVLFILTDDLGYGDVGWTPRSSATNVLARIKTPNLDRLAYSGAILSAHYAAAPVSAPSRASLLTGRVQGVCSLRDNCFDQPFSETNTLASVLRNAGYATWAVGKWGVAGGGQSGKPATSHPLDRGFDYFYGFLDHMAGHTYYHYDGYIRSAYMGVSENRTNATASAIGIYSTDLYTAKAKQLVARHAASRPEQPFFLFLAINTIHGSGRCDDTLAVKKPLHVPGRPYPKDGVTWPLKPEPRELRNTYIEPEYRDLPEPAARYATAIARLDFAIGDLMGELRRLGLEHDTLVVFTSDNGPACEYGADPRNFGSSGPFDGFKRDVFEGGMRVPTCVRWPARIAAGTHDDSPSQFHDWMATLADAAGTTCPNESEGVSLLPRLCPSDKPARPSLVYCQYDYPWGQPTDAFYEFAARKGLVRGCQQMIREGDFVALRTRIGDTPNGPLRLYDVVRDPFQSHDLSSEPEHQERLARLKALLDSRLR